ncbi:MAG: DNA/RNA non-specific endonuclease, partial [Acetatifactor sp.]|nr:DNA/RNA non-specific endonuclease [Acetatifactor sp.]
PSGWHTVKHNGIIDGNYLYNRCHLIAYQLAGENANEKNLITGTRYLNIDGMLPFENMVADYVKATGNHVLYRVTPIFEGENLVASGVLMEAESVEDKGEDIQFCVYVYNVQPGIAIDYLTGESSLVKDSPVTQAEAAPKPQIQEETQTVPQAAPEVNAPSDVETSQAAESEPQGTTYILNTNTKKFHYPSCSSVNEMKAKNKQAYTGNREDVISQGYVPCKRCNP